jgi:hypothetical protein
MYGTCCCVTLSLVLPVSNKNYFGCVIRSFMKDYLPKVYSSLKSFDKFLKTSHLDGIFINLVIL